MEKSQSIQNSPYSPYVRGLVVGSLAGGAIVAGALAVNSFVLSGTSIPSGMTTTSSLKEISTSFASGISGFFMTVIACAITAHRIGVTNSSNGSHVSKIDCTNAKDHWLYKSGVVTLALIALTSGSAGCATLGISRVIERLF